MEAKELRIGNWIDTKDFHVEKLRGLYQYDSSWYKYVHMFEPITLTEEWLLKFGFEYFGTDKLDFYAKNHSDNPELRLHIDSNGLCHCSIGNDFYGVMFQVIKYVHQLQNLYFSLTGNELELK